ncbi:MAG TPA: radical SAM protein [Spirochaetia bacterium]|nr:radical SAM protein [Spirochaetia bacterium]
MQPKTEVTFDRATFGRLARTVRNMSVGRRRLKTDPGFALRLPDEIGIQLTNRCNLRCAHCFQWNKDGFFKNFEKAVQQEEIDFAVVEKILAQTMSVKSNLYLWGGEPLCYSAWDRLSLLLEKDPRWTVFCTNGIDVEKKLESLLRISSHLAMLMSVEGFEAEHDAVRGNGTYKKVMRNIELLLELKRRHIFKGEVSVNCVISENMLGRLYELAELFEGLGINTLYFCFPWYIPETSARTMDEYFKREFAWLRELAPEHRASWHSYSYHLDPTLTDAVRADLQRISGRPWKIRLRYQPALKEHEIEGFIRGDEICAQHRSTCVGLTNRMNVMPDGKVTACKLFPEFAIGDLTHSSVEAVWNSEIFRRVRIVLQHGLMPVCSKCILLYLHGV